MTEKQIEKMKKYVELIDDSSFRSGVYFGRMAETLDSEKEVNMSNLSLRYEAVSDYLILRMEREMKR